MFDPRELTPYAFPAAIGAAIGAAAWLAAEVARPLPDPAALEQQVSAIRIPVADSPETASTADLLAMALFVTPAPADTSVPIATTPQVSIRLHGLSISPRRRAALLSIEGGEAIWLVPGQVEGGVRLQQAGPRSAVLDVGGARREVSLFDAGESGSHPASLAQATGAEPRDPPADAE